MVEASKNVTDYNQEIIPLQEAANNLRDVSEKEVAQARLKKLREDIAAWNKWIEVRVAIDSLKKDLLLDKVENGKMPENIRKLKNRLEALARDSLTPLKLSNILKELPKDDVIWRAFTVQYIVWKLRSEWYDIILKRKWVSISNANESLQENAFALQETFKNHLENDTIEKQDIEQALIISSGSLSEFRDTFWGQINEDVSNKDYIEYLMKKNNISSKASVEEIKCNPKLTSNEKSLIISHISCGISNNPIKPTVENYEVMQKQARDVFDSYAFQSLNSSLNTTNGTPTGAIDSPALARQVTEDPSILSGKPLTVIAAWFAIIYALWYTKGTWFDFWTWVKRWFIWLFWLILWTAVAKEWWVDPKKLLKEWVDKLKEGGAKVQDAASDAAASATSAAKTAEGWKQEKAAELTNSQMMATQKVLNKTDFVSKIDLAAEKTKKWKTVDYVNFINSPKFQDIPLEAFFYNKDQKTNIFLNTRDLDPAIVLPSNLDPLILKRVLRVYLTWEERIDWNKPIPGVDEFRKFESAYIKEKEKNKNLRFTKLVSDIYSK